MVVSRGPSVEERLKALFDALPPGGAVLLQRRSIGEMLGVSASETESSSDLTTEEVAEIFGVKPGTVLDWLHRHRFGEEGIGWYKLGRRYYVQRSALENLAANSVKNIRAPFRLPRQATR